jgi:uncharacterized protein (DUF433 family)
MTLPSHVVHSDPEIMGRRGCVRRPRVLARSLFEYLEAGDSLEVFLDSFPSVSRDQAIAALEIASEALSVVAHSR